MKMVKNSIFALFIIQLFIINFAVADSVQPLLRLSLQDKMISDFENHFLPIFLKNMTNIKINDTSISQHIDFIGNIYLDLTQMVFNLGEITPEQIRIVFNNNSTFSSILEGITANITFDYDFRTNFLNSKGTGKGVLNNLSLNMINKVFRLQNLKNKTLYGPGLAVDQFVFDNFNLTMSFDKDIWLII